MIKKILFILWIFCISISTFVSATSNLYPGIDVSNWQGYINYEEVANDRNSNCIYKSYRRF